MDDKISQSLISELSRLHSEDDTTNFIVSDFIYAYGSPLEALLYAKLFWPDFAQVDEMIFRSDVIEDKDDADRTRQALQKFGGDLEEVERNFNRRYIPSDIFIEKPGVEGGFEGSDETHEQLAQLLIQMWEARLNQVFPGLHFSVILEPRDSTGEVSVTFCRKRS